MLADKKISECVRKLCVGAHIELLEFSGVLVSGHTAQMTYVSFEKNIK